VAAEKLTSFEVGSKNRFLDDSLQLNAGLYYYNYHGFRTAYIPNTPSPADFASFQGSVNLTVPARNIGGELELLYQLTGHDRVGLNYNYVESRWKNKLAAFALAQKEKKRAITPTTITANYEHIFNFAGDSLLSMRIDGRYESAHLTQNLHADWLALGYGQYVHVGSRTIGNLTASWSRDGGRFSVSAYVRNFTNQKYTTYLVQGDPTSLQVNWTDPRTYGAMLSVRF
jgi:iron complex outermembrane receptor protein